MRRELCPGSLLAVLVPVISALRGNNCASPLDGRGLIL